MSTEGGVARVELRYVDTARGAHQVITATTAVTVTSDREAVAANLDRNVMARVEPVNSYGVYVTKQSETTATVFSNQCTHLACRVTWQEENQVYFSPCHNGVFDKQGLVVSGPPPRRMDRYDLKVEENQIFIKVA